MSGEIDHGLKPDLDIDHRPGTASRIGNKSRSWIGGAQQRLHFKQGHRGVLGEVENLKGRIGRRARVETGGVRWGMGCAEWIGHVPGM